MTHLIAGNDPVNQPREINCDSNGNLIPIDFWHNQVHEGDVWTLNYLEEALANTGEMVLCGTTGSKTLHVIIEYANGGDGTFKTYTGATITGGTAPDGVKLSVFNRNPSKQKPLLTQFVYAPTVNALGTPRGLRAITGGSGGNSTGGKGNNGVESNIPPNTKFLFIAKNLSGNVKIAEISIDMYEA